MQLSRDTCKNHASCHVAYLRVARSHFCVASCFVDMCILCMFLEVFLFLCCVALLIFSLHCFLTRLFLSVTCHICVAPFPRDVLFGCISPEVLLHTGPPSVLFPYHLYPECSMYYSCCLGVFLHDLRCYCDGVSLPR